MQGRRRDDSKLSKDPRAIRARLRNNRSKADIDLKLLSEADGRKPIDQWDLDELARGKPRRADGTWSTSSAPKWITPLVQEEIKKRFRAKAFDNLAVYVGPAIKVLSEMLTSEETDAEGKPLVSAKDRIDIAKFIVEHVIGKAPAKLELTEGPKYKQFLADALILDDGEPAYGSQVIDGDWEEADDEGD